MIFPRHEDERVSGKSRVDVGEFPELYQVSFEVFERILAREDARGKAEELLETLKRAQKEPKMSAKKKLISWRTYVPR